MKLLTFFLVLFCIPLWGAVAQESPVTSSNVSASSDQLSAPAAQVLKLSQAGVGEDVLLAYIRGVTSPFHLTADNIIALKNDKISSLVLVAMLNHDAPVSTPAPSTTSVSAPNPDPSAVPGPSFYAPPPIIWIHEPWEWGPYDHWRDRW